jgi:Domain of unknown function (DUF5655)
VPRPLWTCPNCGHRFVTANGWHSCGRYRLADHFRGRAPAVRRVFAELAGAVRAIGPATTYAQKTRIVFQVRVRFASVVTRRNWLDLNLWLKRRARHPALRRVERLPPHDYIHTFRLTALGDLDPGLRRLLREAYATGRQAHLGEARHRPPG